MEIIPFRNEFVSQAAEIFIRYFNLLRQDMPILPDRLEDRARVADMLRGFSSSERGIAAVENGTLVGYMVWYTIDQFRGASRRAAYCPEWAHGATGEARSQVYQAMYQAASAEWAAAGCETHAVTLLANDPDVKEMWFWSGFGLVVVDAVRPLVPLQNAGQSEAAVRQATLDDAETLAMLEAEHAQYYAQPPIFMVPGAPDTADGFRAFMSDPSNSAWLATVRGEPAGYMRFEGSSFGAADIVSSESTVANTGAYVRPAYRGQRIGRALLNAALGHYAARPGFERCSVDFESFNPHAARFWMKNYQPACLSLMRVPETLGLRSVESEG